MRVAIVNRHPEQALGGSEIQCDLIARGLMARGHEVCYVAPSTCHCQSVQVPYYLAQVDFTPEAITQAVSAFEPDVVYWRFNKNVFRPVATRLKRQDLPLVFAVSNANDVRAWVWHQSPQRLHRKVRRFFSHLWQHGGFRYVDALTSLNKDYLGIAPVATQHFVPNAMIADRATFNWPRPYCAWIANIKTHKRPEMLVELAKEMQYSGIDFLMIGKNQSEQYRWLESPGRRPENCHYLGPKTVEEVNGLLAGSLMHIHTCTPEGFGNVFIQAWLQGRPSVSLGFDPGGYMRSEGIGLNAGDDFSAFFQAVQLLIDQPETRTDMGQRAQKFAKQMFSVGALIERVESVLHEAIATTHARNSIKSLNT
jgi:glycosyltransferase involved in cell wall biosynthesis